MIEEYMYTQGDILIAPYEFQKILKLKVTRDLNEHAKLYISGIIDEENIDKYVETSDEKSSITISLKDDKDSVIDVFQGVVTNIQVNANKDVRTLEIEALSRTFLMDIKKKSRTFQDKNSSYGEIFNIVNGEYTNINILDSITNGTKIDKLIVQYKETDWEFIKRLSSHFNVPVVSECQLKDIKYSIGNSGCCTTYEVDKYNYSIKKALQEYRLKSENGIDGLNDINLISYEVITYKVMYLYNLVNFKGKSLYIYSSEMELLDGMISNKYILRDNKGIKIRRDYNDKVVGVSLKGNVLDTKNDTVKINLEIDGNQDIGKARWFSYSTVYSSPDGTGWYCMPEVGDVIRLYFPDNEEKNAYAISSANLKSSNSEKRSDPAVKSIGTKYGKQVVMKPGAVEIIGNGNLLMRLTDDGGIEINSDKKIVLDAKEDIEITGGGKISIQGGNGVDLTQGGAKINIQDNVTMSGGKVKIE
ncbi:contractile injection system protein, VgrG/Pvc8 family [Clostridium estertheticum]|uniref:Phage tail protein n=2 Tax=Clostridium estertheticum TaxID=238834 RepID=A0A1J0GGZ9_9CLOT|nr:contractile injection system protein, VgrG/Pvc8 family [Clostridium estertheticum]APC40587.1 phage tail protein [Clostridium estertheticum subsp. estertheticum]MBZ9617588.1 phage late control D family protein [Clostridium estertheticum subsp. laramiense]WAG73264.1 phage late control D family protein [Clostridium estertheticum]